MDGRILDCISSPADLKVLTNEELAVLAREIREEILTVTSKNGGHVASSLGAVEIILAIHSLIDVPHDKLVFDVGHQAYAHKLVTGRLEKFSTLRCYKGISGFTRPDESPYDIHTSGHASDSLSIALGLALARNLRGSNEKVVALIGDAAISGGMAFEALNTIGQEQIPLVIVLNDNEMSISRNVGALVKHLGAVRSSKKYRQARDTAQERLESGGMVGNALVNFGRNAKESLKQFVLPHAMIFEQLGIVCTPPINGHDIAQLREMLTMALQANGPVLMHVVTKKGAGYPPAEADPERFHGPSGFDIATGRSTKVKTAPAYTTVFGDAVIYEALRDQRIVAITAAMAAGTGLARFSKVVPERFIDVGIAEENAVGMAAGLALGGQKPIVAIYSTFLQRAIDQIIVDCALPNLDVVFAIDRAGLVGADGPTHHGAFDLAYLRMIPHLRIMTPSNEAELACAIHTALAIGGPVAVRYPRGTGPGVPIPMRRTVFPVGKSVVRRAGNDVALLAFGEMVAYALDAAHLLAAQGIEARVVDMRWAKPLDTQAIAAAVQTNLIVTLEAGSVAGGVGEGVLHELVRQKSSTEALTLGFPDEFVQHGSIDLLMRDLGLDAEGIATAVMDHLR